MVFTGDLGNSPSPLLRDTEVIDDADYMLMESCYGDRNHEHRDERKKKLEQIIKENYDRKGTLIIPTFSLERTQELLYEINSLVEHPQLLVFFPIIRDFRTSLVFPQSHLHFQKYFIKPPGDFSLWLNDVTVSFPNLCPVISTNFILTILMLYQ